jgi:ABC-2 type transport system ATP-binding protein
MSDTVIDVRGLRMRYGSRDVLTGVDFAARRGEVITLLGPNGAGKSTTIEILERFRMRSAGEVSVLGVDPARGDERWRARIGVVLQSWRDHGRWRVRDLLAHLGGYYAPYATPERAPDPTTSTRCWRRWGSPSRPASGSPPCPGGSTAAWTSPSAW